MAAKNFNELRKRTSSPERDARVAEFRRAMEDALALGDLRTRMGVTQVRIAERLGQSQANVSRIERQGDLYLSTLREYVEALGGRVEILAVFPEEDAAYEIEVRNGGQLEPVRG